MSELRVLHPVRPESVMTQNVRTQMQRIAILCFESALARALSEHIILAMSQKIGCERDIHIINRHLGATAEAFLKEFYDSLSQAILMMSGQQNPREHALLGWKAVVGFVFYPSLPTPTRQHLSEANLRVYLEQYPDLIQMFEDDLAASVEPEPKAPVQTEAPAPAVVAKKKAKKAKKAKKPAARKEVVIDNEIDDAPQPPAGAHEQRDPQFLVVPPEGSAGETAMAEAFRQAARRAS